MISRLHGVCIGKPYHREATMTRSRRLGRDQDAIDHMNDAIRRLNVGRNHHDIVQVHLAIGNLNRQGLATDSGNLLAIQFDYICGHHFTSDDMIEQNIG